MLWRDLAGWHESRCRTSHKQSYGLQQPLKPPPAPARPHPREPPPPPPPPPPGAGRRSYLDLRLHSYPILQLTGSEESIILADGKIGID